jgi:hypothetical protein
VAYGTFALPNHYGFSGASGDWVRSYFDMSEYAGKTISFRFRFGTDDNTGPANGRLVGWHAVEFMDMLKLQHRGLCDFRFRAALCHCKGARGNRESGYSRNRRGCFQ